MHNKIIEKIKLYHNIVILGFGREGKSTYNFIRKYLNNFKLTIIDQDSDLLKNEDLLNDKNLSLIVSENNLMNLDEYDLIIKTPGISLQNFDRERIKDKITSQIELLLEVNSENIIGITGTKGKSTTSSLLYEVIKNQGLKTFLIGNIGVPVFDQIEEYDDDTILVVEMSSHQLEFIEKSPHIGIVLNLYQDHLDHAGSIENYHQSKLNIFRYQKSSDFAIYDIDNLYLREKMNQLKIFSKTLTVGTTDCADIYFDDDSIYFDDVYLCSSNIKRNILGDHNLKNIMFVLLVSKLLNFDLKLVLDTIKEFQGLEHRMEYVGTFNDIAFYNDTIATIPEATINACNTIENVDTLIFGGQDRGVDYTSLISYLNESSIKNLICMPTTGHKLSGLIDSKHSIYIVETLEEAVKKAYSVTERGKSCLLSPAAPSYEYFKNFEEKGKKYKELIFTFSE